MTLYQDSFGFRKGAAAMDGMRTNLEAIQVVRLDFAAIAAARVAAVVAALAAADVLEIMKVGAGFWVNLVGYKLITAEGATATMDVGDGAAATGFASNINLNGTPGWTEVTLALTEGTPNTITGYSDGKLYTAADTVDVVIDHNDVGVAVIDLVFAVRNYNYPDA